MIATQSSNHGSLYKNGKESLLEVLNIGFFSSTAQSHGKILVVDDETKSILSAVLAFTDLLNLKFYDIENITTTGNTSTSDDKRNNEEFGGQLTYATPGFSTVYFLRPTLANVNHIISQMATRQELNLIFSNSLNNRLLEKLARQDANIGGKNPRISRIMELYLDFNLLRYNCFSLNIPSVCRLMSKDQTEWEPFDDAVFTRCVDGLSAAVCTIAKMQALLRLKHFNIPMPTIRVSSGNKPAISLAMSLSKRLKEILPDLMGESKAESTQDKETDKINGTVLILDRRDDIFGPLLNPWTYQSMIHEQLEIKDNVVCVNDESLNLNPKDDEFFASHLDDNFGEISKTVAEAVKGLHQSSSTNQDTENLVRLIDNYSDQKRVAENIRKHTIIVHALSSSVTKFNLFKVSNFEESIVCPKVTVSFPGGAEDPSFTTLMAALDVPEIPVFEKYRLSLLYSLRPESILNATKNESNIKRIKEILKGLKVPGEEIDLIDILPKFVQQGNPLYLRPEMNKNKGVLSFAKKAINMTMKAATSSGSNTLNQYETVISSILDTARKGRLDKRIFSQVDGDVVDSDNGGSARGGLGTTSGGGVLQQYLIIFILGGATYDEARDVENYTKSNLKQDGLVKERAGRNSRPDFSYVDSVCDIYLGGTCFLNSRNLLADVAQIKTSWRQDTRTVSVPAN